MNWRKIILLLGVAGMGTLTQAQLAQYVQPMAGTGVATTPASLKHGDGFAALNANTVPAVTYPFAMTQWTPQTQLTEQKCIAPYAYKDTLFSGIRASHWLSGSCTQDYGSVTIVPVTGRLRTGKDARQIPFRHADEQATPYQYDIELTAIQLHATVTATARCGLLQFTATRTDSVYLLITPNSDYQEGFIQVNAAASEVSGYNPAHRIYQGWGQSAGFSGYFCLQANRPFAARGVFAGDTLIHADSLGRRKEMGAYIGFYLHKGEQVQVRVGTSFSSLAGARKNLAAEIPGWQLAPIAARCKAAWEKALSAITLTTPHEKDKRIFYTALYHCMQQPRLFNDIDGTYPRFAAQYQLERLQQGNYYDDFSLWDTYRAQLPLMELLQPAVAGDMVNSLIRKGTQGGWLSIFPCWNSYTSEMIGDHCASVIASACLKGIGRIDIQEGYRLLRKNAFELPAGKADYIEGKGRRALDSYLRYGYIPVEDSVPDAFHRKEQVSRTLEYAYDDYAVAQVARKLHHQQDYTTLMTRAGYYKNVFDTSVRMVRGRHANGAWVSPFHADGKEYYITEGTPRQYTFYVPHDVPGLAQLMGGTRALEQSLDTLFANNEYWHGNEPGHQIPFMYNYTGAPWKTQRIVREILEREYSDGPGGLSGNDDAGQMSAWYVFAALGFYPLNPVSGEYQLCSPLFDTARIRLGNGKYFTLHTHAAAPGAIYIAKVVLNGQLLTTHYFTYRQMMQGGTLDVYLQAQPDKR